MGTPEKLEIRTPDGIADAWVYRPQGSTDGASSAVIFYVDAGGVRGTMHDMAARVARAGHLVLLPNVLYRSGNFAPFDVKTVFKDPAERARLMAIMKQLDPAGAMRDAGAYLDAIAELSPVDPTAKVGCMGYCLGGRLAFSTACAYPDRVGAVASIHGGHLVTTDVESPHRKSDRLKARLYIGVADDDPSCTPEHQGALAAALGAAHVDYVMELYAGRAHGFAVADHDVYDPVASELHWRRIEELFDAALHRGGRDTLVS